jgi:predicted O-methyltransferase YrrM
MNNVPELLAKHQAEGDRFAALLANFIVDLQPSRVVETGYGVSTLFIASALEANKKGFLWSVDPKPWFGDIVAHDQHELILKRSTAALADLYRVHGPWDVFIHDSNHDIECMTYEVNFAFECLRPGGWIFCDDVGWGGHRAWEDFLARNGLTDLKLGSLRYTQKPETKPAIAPDLAAGRSEFWSGFAGQVTAERAAAGHEVVSAAFKE